MGTTEPGLALQYVRVVAEFLASDGHDTADVLRRHGISADAFEQPDLVIPFATFERIAAEVLSEVNEPALGIIIGERLAAPSHGALGLAAISSASARELLDLVSRYLATRITVLTVSLQTRRDRASIVVGELLPMGLLRNLVLEAVLLSIQNVLDQASMRRCPVVQVGFPFARPSYAQFAEATFGCPVSYGARRASMTLPLAALDEPLKTADPRAVQLAASLCEREIDKLGTSRSFEIRSRRLMLEHRNGFPSMTQVARRLHVTPRTLDRKLRSEGTSYRAILDDLRHRMAVDLIQSGATMDEVAYLLGYSDTSNFRRAFRRWTGVAPSTLRGDRRGL